MKTRIELVTPKLAEKLLSKNCINRPVKKLTVDFYADIIKKGQWELNGESIKISKEGILLDGQHRLMAIVKSGIPIRTVIVEGLDSSTFDTIDQGVSRTTSDLFNVQGISNATTMSSILCRYNMISNNTSYGLTSGSYKRLNLTKRDYNNEYKKNEFLWDEICRNSKQYYRKMKLLSKSEIGGYMGALIINKGHDPEKVYNFFKQLFYEINPENDTINALKEILINNAISKFKFKAVYKHNLIAKTWNYYISDKSVKKLITKDFDKYIELL